MQTSDQGIAFIKSNEGYAAHVYSDNGKQAIGFGHDLFPNEAYPDGITPEQADGLLRKDLATRYEPAVNALIPSNCTQGQFDALVDFAYNLGTASLKTMVAHGWYQIPLQIPRWQDVNGIPNAGLAARRTKEVEMFNS